MLKAVLEGVLIGIVAVVVILVPYKIGVLITTKPNVVVKTIFVQDTKAVELLEDIMGQDCSNIQTFSMYVDVSAYTACVEECDETPEVTANMTPSRIGLLAVSRDLLGPGKLKMRQRVILPEYGVFIVADVMNARYKDRVDILHANKKAAKLFGVKHNKKLIWLGGFEK